MASDHGDTREAGVARIHDSPRLGWLKNLLLLFAAILVGLVLFEVGLRLAGISFPAFFAYDYHRGIKLAPGKQGWYRQEGNAFLSVNSRGYHDVEHAVEKPPGVYRVAVLGDSFVEARQVDIEETFWKQLERALPNCSQLSGRRVEVLNFGINGYGTGQEWLTLKLDALDFAPDLVLLGFTLANDVADNSRRLAGDPHRPYFSLRDGELVVDNSFRELGSGYLYRRFIMEAVHRSRIVEVLNEARRVYKTYRKNQARRERADTEELEVGLNREVYLPPTDQAWADAWATTEALLQRMAKDAAAAGARFAVMTVPSSIQVHPDPTVRQNFIAKLGVPDLRYPERRISQVGERAGFPVITLDKRMQEVATRKKIYFHGFENTVMGQGHWNEQGHRIVAELLAEDLCARGLLF